MYCAARGGAAGRVEVVRAEDMEARLKVSFSASVFRYEVKIGDELAARGDRHYCPCARSSPASEAFVATLCVELLRASNSQGYERLKPGCNSNEVHYDPSREGLFTRFKITLPRSLTIRALALGD